MLENLTAIIPYRDGQATIGKLLDSLPEALPVIVVDDLSGVPYQTKRPNVRTLRLQERGYFAGACNAGIAACKTDVLILNQDVFFENTQWQGLLDYRRTYAMGGDKVAKHRAFPSAYVQGTFMWLRRDAIDALGEVFDQNHYPLWGCTALAQLRLSRFGFQVLPIHMEAYGMQHARGDAPFGSSIVAELKAEPSQQLRYLRTPPAISVVITCYNYGKFLPDAVASLIGGATTFGTLPPQTFQSFEIIIVDDASTDNTKQVAKALENPWQLLRFIEAPQNMGSAGAANLGIQQAFGKYITVLDADDMMAPERLQVLYDNAQNYPHRILYDDCLEVATDQRTLLRARPNNTDDFTRYHNLYAVPLRLPEYNFDKLLQRNGIHKGIFFERAAWEEAGGYPEEFRDGREDWAFNIALGSHGYCGVHLAQPMYLRRQHGGNRHLRNTNPEWREKFLTQLRTRYPKLYAGERTPMCCGQKGTVLRGQTSGAQTLQAGRYAVNTTDKIPTNMTLVEYQLQKSGTKAYVGPITKRTYVFGGSRRQGFIDTRDADAMLNMIENHQKVFEQVEVAKLQAPAPSVTPSIETTTTTSANAARADAWAETTESEQTDAEQEKLSTAIAPKSAPAKTTPAKASKKAPAHKK